MTRLTKVLFTAASLVAMAGTALAEDEPPPTEEGGGGGTEEGGGGEGGGDMTPPPAEGTPMEGEAMAAPGLTLGKGKIMIGGSTAIINLSSDTSGLGEPGKPISFAPSIWYGVSDKLSVGVTHDGGTTMWTPRPIALGGGICISGEDGGCAKVYDNVSLDVLFGVAQGKFSAAAHGALDVESFDPATLSIRVGLLGQYMASDKLAIVFDPRISIGATERDAGNKEFLDIPVWIWFKANEKLGVYAGTGIAGSLSDPSFGDAYIIPLGLGATYMVNEKLSVGGDFWFFDIAGKTELGADGRILGLRVGYAL